MSLKLREEAIVARTPAADYSAATGKLVDLAAGVATVSSSATTVAKGVILDGNKSTTGYASEKCAIGILGALCGTVAMRAGGTIAQDAHVVQNTDGTIITDPGTGARVVVGVAMEAGVAGENLEVAPITPRVYTA